MPVDWVGSKDDDEHGPSFPHHHHQRGTYLALGWDGCNPPIMVQCGNVAMWQCGLGHGAGRGLSVLLSVRLSVCLCGFLAVCRPHIQHTLTGSSSWQPPEHAGIVSPRSNRLSLLTLHRADRRAMMRPVRPCATALILWPPTDISSSPQRRAQSPRRCQQRTTFPKLLQP